MRARIGVALFLGMALVWIGGVSYLILKEDKPKRELWQVDSGYHGHTYCYFGVKADNKACAHFGGFKRVQWEQECVPNPTCYTLPDD